MICFKLDNISRHLKDLRLAAKGPLSTYKPIKPLSSHWLTLAIYVKPKTKNDFEKTPSKPMFLTLHLIYRLFSAIFSLIRTNSQPVPYVGWRRWAQQYKIVRFCNIEYK